MSAYESVDIIAAYFGSYTIGLRKPVLRVSKGYIYIYMRVYI